MTAARLFILAAIGAVVNGARTSTTGTGPRTLPIKPKLIRYPRDVKPVVLNSRSLVSERNNLTTLGPPFAPDRVT